MELIDKIEVLSDFYFSKAVSKVDNCNVPLKALGVLITSELTWTNHINQAIDSSRYVIRRIKYLRKWLVREDLLQLVTTQYLSIIFYASPLWIGSLKKARDKINE